MRAPRLPHRRIGPTLALGLAPLFAACARDTPELAWEIHFATPELRARAATVEARIAQGGCKSEDLVYLSHFDPRKPGALPPSLPHGVYGFEARAQDKGCRWFAYGCSEWSLPSGRGPVSVRLAQLADEALDCDAPACSSLSCGASDAGRPRVDAAADEDAGSGADAAPPLVAIEIEAESAGTLRAPMMVLQDDNASGGRYIGYPGDPMQTLEQRQNQKRGMPPAEDGDGMAVFAFELPRDASYRLWGRVIASTVDEDSFWIQLDSQPFIQWNDIGHGAEWHWIDVRDFERRTERLSIALKRGRHTLRVAYRELGTLLDKLLIASDLDYIPSD